MTAAERDPREVRRELRIQRAVVGLVLHGYRGDTVGFNSAATELARVEQAAPDELFRPLLWALSRLPRSLDEPAALHDHLAALYTVRDADEDD
ncbi:MULTISPECIES: hypothetical protein [unclassified Gordonia (in: high G+C Gram-positive bacteria)]|uniref:hypothetical protein n=1 Tax=unclassified Gordonia (in: high G+C Gram-positive bacteria) TaxID=2657482 RepID=UPI0009C8C958|nr:MULTISPECIES: hypothetical protein [unclassified Gordonia (in: high G+C Gram-positive bacteria)]SKZ46560.1 Uncharacterised protein [Mycobacteroides abscessus subsp. abscessus]